MTDEEYVRARWVGVLDNGYSVRLEIGEFGKWPKFDGLNKRWSAARAFTEQRALEIVDVEEEIAWLSDGMDCSDPDDEVGQRILAVEQARLAELRRGMKEGSE
jgi:hypothetical protein